MLFYMHFFFYEIVQTNSIPPLSHVTVKCLLSVCLGLIYTGDDYCVELPDSGMLCVR